MIRYCHFLRRKGFYEEAVVLLNKAIKEEKNERTLYINRGGGIKLGHDQLMGARDTFHCIYFNYLLVR